MTGISLIGRRKRYVLNITVNPSLHSFIVQASEIYSPNVTYSTWGFAFHCGVQSYWNVLFKQGGAEASV